MLFVLTILLVSLPLIVYLVTYIRVETISSDVDAQQFFTFLRDDIYHALNVTVDKDVIYLSFDNGDVIQIEQYNTVIRKRRNRMGHVIYLRDVHTFTANKVPYGVKVQVTFEDGDLYEKTIVSYE